MSVPIKLLSTGCSFFSENPEGVFTPEQFSSDEQLMISTAEQFTRKEILPLIDRIDKQEDGLMPSLVAKAGELGFCGADTPEAYGGLGLGKNVAARMLEFLSLNGSFSVTLGVSSGISQIPISLFGSESQKAQYLPRLSSGECIGAYALSEPNSGSDALSATTRADRKGNDYILNGTKMWISNAKWAGLFVVFAKVDGEKFSAFLLERDFPGVEISREEHKLGLKGSSTARVVLDNAVVPQQNLLHEEGKGHHVAFNALNMGRFKLAAMSLGPARDSIEHAIRYAKDRKQFGQSLSTFGLIQKKFAEMAARYFAVESMLYRTGAMIDAAFDSSPKTIDGNIKAAEEFSVECSACKVMATEAEAFIIDESLQVFGGYGFTEEFPLARHYRDARVSRIYEGTNEINRVFLGDRLIRRAKVGRASTVGLQDSFISCLAHNALKRTVTDQIRLGALSDLVMLTYAEQSSRIRSESIGGAAVLAHRVFVDWANAQAAIAFQTVTSEALTLPTRNQSPILDLADAVFATETMLHF